MKEMARDGYGLSISSTTNQVRFVFSNRVCAPQTALWLGAIIEAVETRNRCRAATRQPVQPSRLLLCHCTLKGELHVKSEYYSGVERHGI